MEEWSFLTKHARALVCIARDPASRLRDIAAQLDITERSAFGIVNDLATAGYVVKGKDGRRNRYDIQGHLPLRDAVGRDRRLVSCSRSSPTLRANRRAVGPPRRDRTPRRTSVAAAAPVRANGLNGGPTPAGRRPQPAPGGHLE